MQKKGESPSMMLYWITIIKGCWLTVTIMLILQIETLESPLKCKTPTCLASNPHDNLSETSRMFDNNDDQNILDQRRKKKQQICIQKAVN